MIAPPDHALIVEDLGKRYDQASTNALSHVSFTVKPGHIVGLLGPNGAGKSTLIGILAGMVRIGSGRVRIWEYDVRTQPRLARSAIGVMPQETTVDPFFSPLQSLRLQAGLYGLKTTTKDLMDLLRAVNLEEKAHAYSRLLSGGMKKRLQAALALVHRPAIVVLDEPTAGLDVVQRRELWAFISRLRLNGTTVVLTTHLMEEAEQLCDRIVILNQGCVLADAPTSTIVRTIGSLHVRIRAGLATSRIARHYGERFSQARIQTAEDRDGPYLIIALNEDADIQTEPISIGHALEALQASDLASITDARVERPSLEQAFVNLVSDPKPSIRHQFAE